MYIRIISILFLGIYCISSPIGEQLLRVPIFVAHYYEHQQLDSEITLGEFFKIHYLVKQHSGGDEARDMQLPFKTASQSTGISFFIFSGVVCMFDFILKRVCSTEKYPIFQVQLYGLSALNSIWQPPRFNVFFS